MRPNEIDMTGRIYGNLTVASKNDRKPHGGHGYWNVICTCGNKKVVRADNLRGGLTKSCGKCLDTNRRKEEQE